uniref:Uncharacterized protein n=1 Tax=Arion vulgaris TaxID=1028688 RepID=A0A0B7AYE8_9EUPU
MFSAQITNSDKNERKRQQQDPRGICLEFCGFSSLVTSNDQFLMLRSQTRDKLPS